MKLKLPAGQTSVMLPIFVRDTSSSTGAGLSGLTSGTSGLVGEYRRRGASTWTAITLTSATLGTYTSGGWVADGSLAGAYEVGIPDAAIATAARWVAIRFYGAANMAPVLIELELDAVNYQDGTRFGLSALPNANAEASGGLITRGTGTGQMSVLGGAVSASVSSMGSGVIVAATFGANALGAVWDELKSAHTTANTYGAYLDAAVSTAVSDSSGVTTLLGRLTSTRAGLLDNLDAAISTRSTYAGADTSGTTTLLTRLSSTRATNLDNLDAAVSTRLATASYTAPASTSAIAIAVRDVDNTTPAVSSLGAKVNSAASAGDPWATSLPGSYASGTAGNILGNRLDAAVSTRSTYAGGDTSGTTTLLSRITSTRAGYLDNLTNLDAAVSTRSTFAGGAVLSVTNPVTVGTNNDKSNYTLTVTPPTAAQTASAVLTTALTESYAADGAAPTLTQAILALQQNAFDASISSTTKTVKKLDGSTTALTLTLNDANTPTSVSRTG